MQLLSEYFRAWLVKVVKSRKEFRFYFLDNKIIFRELFRLRRAATGNVPFHDLLAITILLMLHYWTISVSSHQAIINHTAVIRQGSHQTVIRQSSGSHQAVTAVVRLSTGSCHVVIKQLSGSRCSKLLDWTPFQFCLFTWYKTADSNFVRFLNT